MCVIDKCKSTHEILFYVHKKIIRKTILTFLYCISFLVYSQAIQYDGRFIIEIMYKSLKLKAMALFVIKAITHVNNAINYAIVRG